MKRGSRGWKEEEEEEREREREKERDGDDDTVEETNQDSSISKIH